MKFLIHNFLQPPTTSYILGPELPVLKHHRCETTGNIIYILFLMFLDSRWEEKNILNLTELNLLLISLLM
jgi:hypothetical protein